MSGIVKTIKKLFSPSLVDVVLTDEVVEKVTPQLTLISSDNYDNDETSERDDDVSSNSDRLRGRLDVVIDRTINMTVIMVV